MNPRLVIGGALLGLAACGASVVLLVEALARALERWGS